MALNLCKDSANREKNQIYLSFSEVKPIFEAKPQSSIKWAEYKKNKFIFYSRTDGAARGESNLFELFRVVTEEDEVNVSNFEASASKFD